MSTTTYTEKTAAPAGTWQIDTTHSQVGFEVKHLGVATFRGRFDSFEGTVTTSERGVERIAGAVDVASVDVRDDKLSGHLGSSDFFDAENYPKGYLESKQITPGGEGRYRVLADLTLRGVSNEVELDLVVEGPHEGLAGLTLGLAGSGEIDRFDYGISWDSKLESGVAIIAEKVRLVIEVEAVLEV